MEPNNPSIEALPFDFFDDQSQYQFVTFPMEAAVSPLQRLRQHRQLAVPNRFADREVLLQRGQLTNHSMIAPSWDEVSFKELHWRHPLSHFICALFLGLFLILLMVVLEM